MGALTPPHTADADTAAAADQRPRLRAALALIEQMAGENSAPAVHDPAGDDGAAYARATPIARRRFDALAAEAGAFATAGVAALIRYREVQGRDCAAGAAQLARDMRKALTQMDQLIPPT